MGDLSNLLAHRRAAPCEQLIIPRFPLSPLTVVFKWGIAPRASPSPLHNDPFSLREIGGCFQGWMARHIFSNRCTLFKIEEAMPAISMFYGIIVYMYFMDIKQHKCKNTDVPFHILIISGRIYFSSSGRMHSRGTTSTFSFNVSLRKFSRSTISSRLGVS